MRIGDIVIFTAPPIPSDPRRNLPDDPIDYPAIVYDILDATHLGMTVFTHEGVKNYRHVPYCAERKPNSWRERDATV